MEVTFIVRSYCSGLLESQITFLASNVLCDAHITDSQSYQVQLLLMFLASDHESKGKNCDKNQSLNT